MPIINKGTSFSNGEQLTADKINNLLDLATFNQSATDSASTTVNSASQIVVADSGITTAKLATDAVETAQIKDANVTTAKIADANVTFAKLADVIDSDTMTGASATTLATSESIKAYVDTSKTSAFTPSTYIGGESVTLPNGLIMKFGTVSAAGNSTTTVTFDANLDVFTGTVNAQLTRIEDSQADSNQPLKVGTLSNTQLTIRNTGGTTYDVFWQVIGY